MTATPAHAHAHAHRYLTAWNETDPAARRAAVDEVSTIGAVQAQFPGFVFRLAGPVDAHHDQVRFTWELGPEGAEAPIAGSDVALLDAD